RPRRRQRRGGGAAVTDDPRIDAIKARLHEQGEAIEDLDARITATEEQLTQWQARSDGYAPRRPRHNKTPLRHVTDQYAHRLRLRGLRARAATGRPDPRPDGRHRTRTAGRRGLNRAYHRARQRITN